MKHTLVSESHMLATSDIFSKAIVFSISVIIIYSRNISTPEISFCNLKMINFEISLGNIKFIRYNISNY